MLYRPWTRADAIACVGLLVLAIGLIGLIFVL
jgi:hypothetical protein